MKATLGSRNPHKARELERLLPGWTIVRLEADDWPPETGATYLENALFVVLFPRGSAKRATRLLEEARVAVENLTLDVSLSTPAKPSASGASARPAKVVERTVSVTISAGVAENETAGVDPKEMIEAAEQALQRARQAGMNRVAR